MLGAYACSTITVICSTFKRVLCHQLELMQTHNTLLVHWTMDISVAVKHASCAAPNCPSGNCLTFRTLNEVTGHGLPSCKFSACYAHHSRLIVRKGAGRGMTARSPPYGGILCSRRCTQGYHATTVDDATMRRVSVHG